MFSIGIIDLDGFKGVNDTHGHKVGDLVLSEVARRLMSIEDRKAQFHRLGGDEFAFLVTGSADGDALRALGHRIIECVSQPINCGSVTASVGCSIGIASYPDAAREADLLFEYCDYALYEAKRSGRRKTEIFSESHRSRMVEQNAIEHAFRSADFDEEIYPVFQPITNTRTGQTIAIECLARWNSRKLGNVSPAEFIPAAEQWGLVSAITKVMIKKALVVAAAWPEHVKLSINLSPNDIMSAERVGELLEIVNTSGLSPKKLVFELTETAFIKNFDVAQAQLERLRASGAEVALDDFGAGYSSLSHVHALPLDKLKVDRRFIADIETNETSRSIIRHVSLLCGDLGICCVAEGVETNGQLKVLEDLGCSIIQGYLIARPMPAEDLADYLMKDAEAKASAAPASDCGRAAEEELQHRECVAERSYEGAEQVATERGAELAETSLPLAS